MGDNVVNRTSAYLYRIGFSYTFLLVGIVRGVILVPLYVESISIELYGAWLATGYLLAYLGLLDFGFTAVVQQQVAQQYGKKALEKVASISSAGILIGIGFSGIVGALGYYLADYAPGFIGMTGPDAPILSKAISIGAVSTAIMLLAYFPSAVLIALQRTAVNALLNLLTMILGVATTYYCLNSKWGLLSLPIGSLVYAITFLLGVSVYLYFVWGQDIGMQPTLCRRDFQDLSSLSGFVFFGKVASRLISQSDTIIVAKVMGPELAAIFSLTSRVKDQTMAIPHRIAALIVPNLAHLTGEGNVSRIKQIAWDALSATVGLTSLFAAGILALNEAFVHLWVGNHLFGGVALTAGICIYYFLEMGRSALYNLLFALGEIRIPSLLGLVEAGLKIAFVIAGVHWLGLVGAPLGSIVALMVVNSVYLSRLFVRKFGITRADLSERSGELFVYPLIAFGIGATWSLLPSPQNWLVFSLNVLSLGGLLAILLWMFSPNLRRVAKSLIRRPL